jgi:hypothetical protein
METSVLLTLRKQVYYKLYMHRVRELIGFYYYRTSYVHCVFKSYFSISCFFVQSPQEMDKLSEEFVEFQLLHEDDIPKQIWGKGTVKVDTILTRRATTEWMLFGIIYFIDLNR